VKSGKLSSSSFYIIILLFSIKMPLFYLPKPCLMNWLSFSPSVFGWSDVADCYSWITLEADLPMLSNSELMALCVISYVFSIAFRGYSCARFWLRIVSKRKSLAARTCSFRYSCLLFFSILTSFGSTPICWRALSLS